MFRRGLDRDEVVRAPHQDIRDVETTVYRQNTKLDWGYIEEHLLPLVELKEEPEILRTLERVRKL